MNLLRHFANKICTTHIITCTNIGKFVHDSIAKSPRCLLKSIKYLYVSTNKSFTNHLFIISKKRTNKKNRIVKVISNVLIFKRWCLQFFWKFSRYINGLLITKFRAFNTLFNVGCSKKTKMASFYCGSKSIMKFS